MPAPRGDRSTRAARHRACAATLTDARAQGIAPWQQPWTPGTRARVEPCITTRPARAATNKELSDGMGSKKTAG